MAQDIQQMSGLRLGPSTLYGAITRLDEGEWIETAISVDAKYWPWFYPRTTNSRCIEATEHSGEVGSRLGRHHEEILVSFRWIAFLRECVRTDGYWIGWRHHHRPEQGAAAWSFSEPYEHGHRCRIHADIERVRLLPVPGCAARQLSADSISAFFQASRGQCCGRDKR